ncbi:MAG: hypothetical protein M1826_006379 [Phylliscum demangeonii]|nr:MAG: hypothetical protein M1826_006379 [Phylliscum demangeonii]
MTMPLLLRTQGPASSADSSGPSNADKWFDRSNKNVRRVQAADDTDEDPPFYMADSCRLDAGAGAGAEDDPSRPDQYRTELPKEKWERAASCASFQNRSFDGESSGGFRSVIDDLTLENRRLRQKLRKYQKVHASHLPNDRLFEVTFHALDGERRRQLEEKLAEFASRLEESSINPNPPTGLHLSSDPSLSQPGAWMTSRPAESGYGSVSISGLSSAPKPHPRPTPSAIFPDREPENIAADRAKNLHPKHGPWLPSHVKKKLVVRRLEQLFTGRALQARGFGQGKQQRNISKSAAEADPTQMKARGQNIEPEGMREARISTIGTASPGDDADAGQDAMPSAAPTRANTPGSTDQRPTRPLDLDLRRAQLAADNIDYIRHLGIVTPNIDRLVDAQPTEGWVYLNLLASMAQLHTINVTPRFIRQAVSELSATLELSDDGRKIRWKGGWHGTKLSSDSGSRPGMDDASSGEEMTLDAHPTFTRRQTSHGYRSSPRRMTPNHGRQSSGHRRIEDLLPASAAGVGGDAIASGGQSTRDRMHYQPLFFRPMSSDQSSDGRDETESADSWPSPSSDDGVKGAKNHRGPLIFYQGAPFCTDLAGEAPERPEARRDPVDYPSMATKVVGCEPPNPRETTPSPSEPGDRPLMRWSLSVAADPSNGSLSFSNDAALSFDFERASSPHRSSADLVEGLPRPPYALDASGLAGVRPADNFVVDVQVRHQKKGPSGPSMRSASTGHEIDMPATAAIVHTTCINLPASTLPPPFCFIPSSPSSSSSSSSSATDESEEDEDEGGPMSGERHPSPSSMALRAVDRSGSPPFRISNHGDEEDGAEEEDDEEDENEDEDEKDDDDDDDLSSEPSDSPYHPGRRGHSPPSRHLRLLSTVLPSTPA